MGIAAGRLERGWRTLNALLHGDEYDYLKQRAAQQSKTERETVSMAECLRRLVRENMNKRSTR